MKIATVETFPLFLSKEDAKNSYAGESAIEHRGYMVKPPGWSHDGSRETSETIRAKWAARRGG